MDFPPVTIVMTTYFPEGEIGRERRLAAMHTLQSWRENMEYSGRLNVHLADDGSNHPLEMMDWFRGYGNEVVYSRSKQIRGGVGASLNTGFRKAYETSPLVLYAVDDWSLTEFFNITPWVRLLIERSDVGMVRLGPPHPNTTGKVEMFTDDWQGWGLRLDRYAYAYGQRPALYHERFTDHYGWFKEGVSALDCEREYAENFVRLSGPDIVLALPHPWQHIDTVSMSDMTPGG